MQMMTRDWVFIVIAGALLAILMVHAGREKPSKVPSDRRHRHLLDAVASGSSREEVEKVCVSCHNVRAVPLPKMHPPKEQCLLCHTG